MGALAQVVLLRREMAQEEVSAHPLRSLHASRLHLACFSSMCTLICVHHEPGKPVSPWVCCTHNHAEGL